MQLRGKITLVILAIVGLYAVLDFTIQRLVILPSFLELEQADSRDNVLRSQEAIQNEMNHINLFAINWSMWDDTYRFVQDGNDEFIKVNLMANAFSSGEINIMFFYNASGKLIWGKYYDLLKSGDLQDFAALPKQAPKNDRRFAFSGVTDSFSSIMITSLGPLLYVSMPIVKSTQEGPIMGTLIVGRLLTGDMEKRLVQQTHVNFRPLPVTQQRDQEITHVLAAIGDKTETIYMETKENTQVGYALFPDYLGQPALLVRAITPRDISAKGERTLIVAVISVVVAGILVVLVLLGVLKVLVVQPILRVTRHALAVGQGTDYSLRLNLHRPDEIGLLADEIDSMVTRLADYQKRLADQSYHAGMAEHAAATLHNLRNALVSLTVPIETIHASIQRMPLPQLAMALDELSQDSIAPTRREALENFVKMATRSWLNTTTENQATFANMLDRIRLIESVLAQQEHFSRHTLPLEHFHLDELLSDAMRLEAAILAAAATTMEIDSALHSMGSLHLPRVVLLQVVTNIITNATESIRQLAGPSGHIRVSARVLNETPVPQVEVLFCDNGGGIAPDDVPRIFARSFSTKSATSPRGLGLHWCVNAVTAMGGQLLATSPGSGQGATFRLILPRSMEPEQHG